MPLRSMRRTGKVKWHFSPGEIGKFQNFGLNFNRGLAYCNNTLYMLTLDMRIMAIDPASGKLVKEVNIPDTVPDAKTEYGYYETAAPICYNGTLHHRFVRRRQRLPRLRDGLQRQGLDTRRGRIPTGPSRR